MEIFHRLANVRKALGGSQGVFAKKLGLSQSTYANYEKGSRALPDSTKNALSRFGINLHWLITGEGSMFRSEKSEDKDDFRKIFPDVYTLYEDHQRIKKEKKENRGCSLCEIMWKLPSEAHSKVRDFARWQLKEKERVEAERAQREAERTQREAERVQQEDERIEAELKRYSDEVSEPEREYETRRKLPLYEVVAAGKPLESLDAGETFSVPLSRLHGNPKQYFAVRVRGESMTEAGIYDNSIAVIREELDLIDGKIYLLRREGEYTLKRYRLGNDMKPKLLYEDGTGREMKIHEGEDWEVVGVFCFVG